jgi:N utilization substance protein A
VAAEEAEDLIMRARLKAGWVTEEDLAAMNAEEETGEEATESEPA